MQVNTYLLAGGNVPPLPVAQQQQLPVSAAIGTTTAQNGSSVQSTDSTTTAATDTAATTAAETNSSATGAQR
jgi:hypothetical protein